MKSSVSFVSVFCHTMSKTTAIYNHIKNTYELNFEVMVLNLNKLLIKIFISS